MRLSSASASIWSTITRRICAALSAVSCGSSRMPRRSSWRVVSSSRCISAGHLLHALHDVGEALGRVLQHLLGFAGGLPEHRLRVARRLFVGGVQGLGRALRSSSEVTRTASCCSAIARAPSALASATMRAMSRARPSAAASDSSSRAEKRLSR